MSNIWHGASAAEATRIDGLGAIAKLSGLRGFRPMYDEAPVQPQSFSPADAGTMVDPEEIRAAAFTEGFEEGMRVAREEALVQNHAAAALADALAQLQPVSDGTLSALISTAVMRLVRQVVGNADVDAELLMQRCMAVAACIEDAEGTPVLRVNPDDVALIDQASLGVRVMADPELGRGSVRLETKDGWVEDGPDVRVARLAAVLDDMEGRH